MKSAIEARVNAGNSNPSIVERKTTRHISNHVLTACFRSNGRNRPESMCLSAETKAKSRNPSTNNFESHARDVINLQ